MAERPLRVGTVGAGFMGKAHANAWRQAGRFFDLPYTPVLQVLCARDAARAGAFAANWGYADVETDWRKLVARDDVDVIDVCAPNNLHEDIAVAAAEAGKWVVCEKPLALDVAGAKAMVAAVERAGVPNMVWYNYRRVPAVSLAKRLIDEGRVGSPYHYRAQFLQDWTMAADLPQGGAALWRLDGKVAGSGVVGDLLAHNFDTAMWLNGPIIAVMAETETFIKERVHRETGETAPVTVDDACAVMARFANGSLGLFESTRFARGHKALKTFEINGADGSLAFDLHEPEYLRFFEYRSAEAGKAPGHLNGWRTIHVTNPEHPYMDRWWVPGLTIGYEHSFVHAVADFVTAAAEGRSAAPTFKDALQTQRVCGAVLRSAESRTWQDTEAETLT